MSRYAASTRRLLIWQLILTSISSEFPKDPEQGNLLLVDISITHFLTVSPSQTTSIALKSVKHRHINVSNSSQEALLLILPEACDFIRNALAGNGQVLVHCRAEMRACIIVAAHGMHEIIHR
jgi:dual specificity phosphatase 12